MKFDISSTKQNMMHSLDLSKAEIEKLFVVVGQARQGGFGPVLLQPLLVCLFNSLFKIQMFYIIYFY